MKPSQRDIARSQPVTSHAPPDLGAGLREHVEGSGRTAPGIPEETRDYVFDVRDQDGRLMWAFPPEGFASADQRAAQIGGFVTASPVVVDYRHSGPVAR